MNRNTIIQYVTIFLSTFVLISGVFGKEKIEPKLLWQNTFNEPITWPVSITDDGRLVLVTTLEKLYLVSGDNGEI